MGSLSKKLVVAAMLAILAELLLIIGLSTTEWIDANEFDLHFGLFRKCLAGKCAEIEDPPKGLEAVRALVVLAMLCGLVVAVTSLVYVIYSARSRCPPRRMLPVCIAACVGTCLFTLIGILIFGIKYHEEYRHEADLGYSFGVCILGAILIPVTAVLIYREEK